MPHRKPTDLHHPNHDDDEHVQLRRLKLASLVEGTTLVLLLFIAVPLKHVGGWPLAVQMLGPIHGLAFLTYVWVSLQTVSGSPSTRRWADGARLVLLGMLPFGGFLNAALLSRSMQQPRSEQRT